MNSTAKQPIVVYAESTPNPAAMKFVANTILLENSMPLEFLNPAEAKSSPLATALFKFPFVKSVFISANYITLFKAGNMEWNDVVMEVREFLREYISAEKSVLSYTTHPVSDSLAPEGEKKNVKNGDIKQASITIDHIIPQTELEKKIVDVLEQYVRPAVELDGGAIVFRKYNDGVVHLLLRGACSGCPSSTLTLKAGIEALLKKFVPEVKEVVSVS